MRKRILSMLPLAFSILFVLGGFLSSKFSWLDDHQVRYFFYGAVVLFSFSLVGDARRLLKRGDFRSRQSLQSSLNGVGIVLSLIVINVLAAHFEKKIDLTAEQVFSLSDQTIKTLSGLSEDVNLFVFVKSGGAQGKNFNSFIKRYQQHTSRLRPTLFDPDVDVEQVKKYSVAKYGSLVLEHQGHWVTVDEWSEESLMSALIRLFRKQEEWLCYVRGHQETDLNSTDPSGFNELVSSLKKLGYQFQDVLLPQVSEVDARCRVLVILAPPNPLNGSELKLVHDFFLAGKSLLIFLEPGQDGGLESLLKSWGAKVVDNFVVDPKFHLALGPVTSPFIANYSSHPVSEGVQEVSLFPLARGLGKQSPPPDLKVDEVAFTSTESWGETDFKNASPQFDRERDYPGPLALIMTIQRQPRGRILLFGDANFAMNQNIHFGANRQLLSNGVLWLSEEEDSFKVDVHRRRETRLNITDAQLTRLKVVVMYVFPAICFIVLFALWYPRRSS